MGAAVVAGCDTSPVLQPTEGILDAMALAVERPVIGQWQLARPRGWDARGDATLDQCGSEPGAVVAAVAEQFARPWQDRQQQGSTVVVAALPLGEQQGDGAALAVAGGMEFGVQAAFGAADTPRTPFCSRLAAVRCALRWVASIISRAGAPPLAAKAAKMRANTPSRLQRMNRL